MKKSFIRCKTTDKGIQTFYLFYDNNIYELFSQNYRKGVKKYYSNGVSINQAIDYSRAHNDQAIIRTMYKILIAVRKFEKEFAITVFNKTDKSKQKHMKYVA